MVSTSYSPLVPFHRTLALRQNLLLVQCHSQRASHHESTRYTTHRLDRNLIKKQEKGWVHFWENVLSEKASTKVIPTEWTKTSMGEKDQSTSGLDIRAYFNPVTFTCHYPFYENIIATVTIFLQFKGEKQLLNLQFKIPHTSWNI